MRPCFSRIIFLILFATTGCSSAGESIAVTDTAVPPTVTITAQATATAVPTDTPEPTAPPATATITAILVTAVAHDNGTITLDDMVVLDIEAEGIPCFPDIPAEIIYSPTGEHFLVVPACIEGDNQLYLFRADGTGKQRITGAWDLLNFSNVTWADDGQSFTYERINSCCLTPPEDAPPVGLVQYDLATGTKTLVATPTPRPS